MRNEAILSLMDHLCNQARNAMHVAFGLMEFHPDSASRPSWQTCVSATRSSADRLLLTIDDMRELSGRAPAVVLSANDVVRVAVSPADEQRI